MELFIVIMILLIIYLGWNNRKLKKELEWQVAKIEADIARLTLINSNEVKRTDQISFWLNGTRQNLSLLSSIIPQRFKNQIDDEKFDEVCEHIKTSEDKEVNLYGSSGEELKTFASENLDAE